MGVIDPLKLLFNATINNAGIVYRGIIIFNQLMQIMPPFAFRTISLTVSQTVKNLYIRSSLGYYITYQFYQSIK